jgi:hypothetical protein
MTANHRYLTPGQVEFFTKLVNERFAPEDDAGRAPYRAAWRAISTKGEFDAVVADLKSKRPLSWGQATRAASITEPGYYRNPADGTLYRLVERKEGLRVAEYSKTGGPRRLDVRGNLVKGHWIEKGKWDSAKLRRAISPEWLITEDGLLEFAYGFCPFHGGPLTDGVSVALGYGKVCADKHGLPWGEEAARAVLRTQGIDADAFLAQHAKAVG